MTLDASAEEVQSLVDVRNQGLGLRQAQSHRGQHFCYLLAQDLGVVSFAADQDHEVVGLCRAVLCRVGCWIAVLGAFGGLLMRHNTEVAER